MLEIFYRYCPIDNQRSRPSWYSKKICLKSFIGSLALLQDDEYRFHFIVDDASHWEAEDKNKLLEVLEPIRNFELVQLNVKSNTGSYSWTMHYALKQLGNILLFVEDDYLWQENAVTSLLEAITVLPCDYITPYDHPVRYDKDYFGGTDLPHWHHEIYCTGSWHFRPQESTCMTFMTKQDTLREDIDLHMLYSTPEHKVPNDRELFRNLQGLGTYSGVEKQRLLLGPMPSLATHVHLPYLAPAVDWDQVASKFQTN